MRQLTGAIEQLAIPQPAARAGAAADAEWRRSAAAVRQRSGHAAARLRRSRRAAAMPAQAAAAAARPGDCRRSASPTCSIRRSIRMRRERRARLAAAVRSWRRSRTGLPPCQMSARPAVASAGAPLDLSTLVAPPIPAAPVPRLSVCGGSQRRRPLAAAAAAQSERHRRRRARCSRRRDSPKDEYDLAYGYVLRKDYALAENAFKTFLHDHPSDRLRRRCELLARREPVPAPAIIATPPNPSSIRPTKHEHVGQGAGCAAIGSASRSRRWAKRKSPARRSARSAANIRALRASVKQGVEREQKRVHC